MTDAPKDSGANPPPVPGRRLPWLFPAIRVAFLVAAGSAAWYIAGNWDRLTGEARFEATDDAYTAGDLTPLSAKISGYVARVAVNDYQAVHQGELLVEIDPADYRAQLALANANLAAAEAALANIANQKDVQRALIRQAEATIAGTKADLERYRLEDARQIDLLKTNLAGTRQNVEQANANDQRTRRSSTSRKACSTRWIRRKNNWRRRSWPRGPTLIWPPTTSVTRASWHPSTGWSASARCGPASSSIRARR